MQEPIGHGEAFPRIRIDAPLPDDGPAAEKLDRRLIQNHIALLGIVFAGGHPRDGCTCQSIQTVDRRIADNKPPRRAGRDRYFETQRSGCVVGQRHRRKSAHGMLHGKAAGRRPRPTP